MKYHKIRNVDKSVCTAEQKIAYNAAFYHTFDYRETWKKYDIDAIQAALNAGMENYFNGCSILSSYEEIGKTFPALYLNQH